MAVQEPPKRRGRPPKKKPEVEPQPEVVNVEALQNRVMRLERQVDKILRLVQPKGLLAKE